VKSATSKQGYKYTIWQSTFRSILRKSYSKSSRPRGSDGHYVWRAKDSEEPPDLTLNVDPSEGKPIKCRKTGRKAVKQASIPVQGPDLPCIQSDAGNKKLESSTVSVPEMDGHNEITAN